MRQLAQDSARAQQSGKIPDDLRYLHGFTWFFGFIIDAEGGDVWLLGLHDPSRPRINLDCLVAAARAAYEGKAPSCSLDADPDPNFQKSRVENVPWETRWAEIMIEADYYMKKICQGRINTGIPGLNSWFDLRVREARRNRGAQQRNRWDHTARVWDVTTGRCRLKLDHDNQVHHASFSHDGQRIVTACEDGTARIWDATSGKQIGQSLQHDIPVRLAAFSRHGQWVATAGDDATARIWDALTGLLLQELKHDKVVNHVAFSADDQMVVTCSSDRTARVWNAATWKHLSLLHNKAVLYADFSHDGRRVVTASADHTARIWDVCTGQLIGMPMTHAKEVRFVAFSRDGRMLVTASADTTARIWDGHTGAPICPPLRHCGEVARAAFSEDGRWLATACHDQLVRVWDLGLEQTRGLVLQHGDACVTLPVAPITAGWRPPVMTAKPESGLRPLGSGHVSYRTTTNSAAWRSALTEA